MTIRGRTWCMSALVREQQGRVLLPGPVSLRLDQDVDSDQVAALLMGIQRRTPIAGLPVPGDRSSKHSATS